VKLSLKKVFYIFFFIAASALLVLSGFSLYFNSQLVRNQNTLNSAAAIDSYRYMMSNAISNILSRQEKILLATDLNGLDTLPDRKQFEASFTNSLDALLSVASIDIDVISAIHSLKPAYERFLDSDQELLNVAKVIIGLKGTISDQAARVDTELNQALLETENIIGVLSLENTKIVRKAKEVMDTQTFLDTPQSRENFKVTVSRLLVENESTSRSISESLSLSFLKLSALMRNIIEETDLDKLRDLKNNQINQLFSLIRRDLKKLANIVLDTPELYQTAVDVEDQFEAIAYEFMGNPNRSQFDTKLDMFELRLSQKIQEDKLHDAINAITKNQLYMTQAFFALDTVASKLRNNLVLQAHRIADLNRIMISVIVICVFIIMLLCGYFLVKTMTDSFNVLTGAMEKIANEEEDLSYRVQTSAYEDFNKVGQSFNTMTSKLQFINTHLQDLVNMKTQELSEANEHLEADIERRIKVEKEVQDLNQKLVDTARRAGMADVATSVLHNVGNIANSVNVSLGLLKESVDKSKFDKLVEFAPIVTDYLDKHAHESVANEDAEINPKYLNAIVKALQSERQLVTSETRNLIHYVGNIQEILAMQQSVGGGNLCFGRKSEFNRSH